MSSTLIQGFTLWGEGGISLHLASKKSVLFKSINDDYLWPFLKNKKTKMHFKLKQIKHHFLKTFYRHSLICFNGRPKLLMKLIIRNSGENTGAAGHSNLRAATEVIS